MDDLSILFPVPEPVTLGGEPFLAVCFQLRDLARLQAIVRGLAGGDPLAGRRRALLDAKVAAPGGDYLGESPEGRAYAAALRGAIRALDGWPPALGSGKADALLATGAGRALWLEVLLGRTNPDFTAARGAELIVRGAKADPDTLAEELMALEGIAYADHPADWLVRLMEPPPRRRGKAGGGWGEAIVALARETGWTISQCGELYLSQFHVVKSEGKVQPGEIVKTKENGAWYRRAMERRRRLLMQG